MLAAVWRRPPASCRMQTGSGLGAIGGGTASALRTAFALRAALALRAAGASGLLGGLLAATATACAGTGVAVAGDLLDVVHGGVPSGCIDDGMSSMTALSPGQLFTDSVMRRKVGACAGTVSPIDRVVTPSSSAGPPVRAAAVDAAWQQRAHAPQHSDVGGGRPSASRALRQRSSRGTRVARPCRPGSGPIRSSDRAGPRGLSAAVSRPAADLRAPAFVRARVQP